MTKNGNGYVQVFDGPDGEPIVVLRAVDFLALVLAVDAERTLKEGLEQAPQKNTKSNLLFNLTEYQDEDMLRTIWRFVDNTSKEDRGKLLSEVLESCLKSAPGREIRKASPFIPKVKTDADTADAIGFAEAQAAVKRGEDELVPENVARQLLSGEPPLRVWRQYRGLTQTELAKAAGLKQSTISGIETGKNKGDVGTLRALADVLNVQIDDLVL